MMNIYKFGLTLLAGAALVSCVDLNTEPLSSVVTSDQKAAVVAADPSKVEASVTAIFSNFKVYGAWGGEDQHNDFGYPSVMLFLDSRGQDLVGLDIGYNWFSYGVTYKDVQSTNATTNITWTTLYNQIYSANAVISVLDPETQDPQSQYYLAQALATRAFDYFTLAQIYQYTYVGHEDELCVPILTEKNAAACAIEGCARSTVKETYDQILSDINLAVELLEKSQVTPADKRYISAAVARGIRARIYSVMNDWEKCYDDCEAAITAFGAAPASLEAVSVPSFIEIEDSNWMWGVLITDKDRCTTTGICNFASHMGSLNYGYASVGAWRMISKKLFASIPETDVRRGWFLDANCESKNLTAEQQAYCNTKAMPAYTQVKFAPAEGKLGGSENNNDVPLMRIEEMHLLKAEALAMKGDKNGAKDLLKNFVTTYRNPAFTLSDEDIVDQIWNQRRIEFWGEGISWFDIMRLKKGFDRRGCGWPATGVFNFEAEAPEFVIPIPYNEAQYNKLITGNVEVAKPEPITDIE